LTYLPFINLIIEKAPLNTNHQKLVVKGAFWLVFKRGATLVYFYQLVKNSVCSYVVANGLYLANSAVVKIT
jgi:hypothetical protein